MKINLLYGSDNVLSGFLNIDPFAKDEDIKKNKGRVDNLDEICEDAECLSIIAEDIIDYFSSKEVDNIISHWIKKLRHGGKIVIGGIDLIEVSRSFNNKYIDLINTNLLLFGDQSESWKYRKSCLTSSELVKGLQGLGLNILKNRINNYKYTIEAERP
jgi:hypothetical protein